MSNFKFGLKIRPKTIGGINVGDPEEWTLLIKPQFKDETLFVHFHCVFKHILTQEEIDARKITKIGIIINTGFVKDDKFCIIHTHKIAINHGLPSLMKYYKDKVESFMSQGYQKDDRVSGEPMYHKFDKNSNSFSQVLNNLASLSTSSNNPLIKMQAAMTSSNTSSAANP